MPLAAGTKLGPYEILAPIGAGGMGEVYRARDTRLNRDVAIKVSQERFSDRFEREARAVAALNHPNICTLYDVGPNYLVMELIEGESPKGPLPFEEVLRLMHQIADALDAAHEKGIVHRDLKPGNIKIKHDGTVKVLDFGLAKTAEAPGGDPQNSPTMTISPTRAGMIMGTAAYMSPEQARGRTVDKRADIWAFGVVLYELLTGRRPFHGEDLTETLASVMKDTPDLSSLPVEVRPLVEKCLQKDLKKRLRDIGDAWGFVGEPAASAVLPKSTWIWAAAVVVLGVAALAGWLRPESTTKDQLSLTLSILPPPGLNLARVGGPNAAPELSPDGTAITYTASGLRSYIRRLDSLESSAIPDRNYPVLWSPDSTSIVLDGSRQLTRVRLPAGGPEAITTPSGALRGGSWSDSGTILISAFPGLNLGAFLSIAPASGGEAKPVEMPMAFKEGACYHPQFLPGGQDFLFLYSADSSEPAVYLASLRDGKAVDPVLLLRNLTAARYTPAGGGRILFVRNDSLYSQKLNLRARKLEGESELLVQGVASQPALAIHRADFSVARNGTVAWRPGKAAVSQMVEFDRKGNQLGTSGPPGQYVHLYLSPDEKRLLVASWEAGWLAEVGQSGLFELPRGIHWFSWIAGGSRLIGGGHGAFVEMSSSGSGEVRELRKFEAAGALSLASLSSDTKQLFIENDGATLSVPLTGPPEEMQPKVVIPSSDQVHAPSFSTDGRWLVYSVGTGIYARPFPGPGPRRQIADRPGAAGRTIPLWRKDGKEVLYTDGDSLMSIAVRWNGDPSFAAPQKVFSGLRYAPGLTPDCHPLAVSRDGSRIFWLQGVEQPESNVIHVKIGAVK